MKIKYVLASICFSLALAGCDKAVTVKEAPFELKLVDKYHGEYEVDFPIDVENFFYYSDRSQVETMVSYTRFSRNVNEIIPGNVFVPHYEGSYLFTCSSKVKTINKRIEVVAAKPTLTVKEAPVYIETGNKVLFSDIFAEIAPSYTPYDAEPPYAYNVQFAPYNDEISEDITKPFVDYDFSGDGFTAKNPGLYRVHIRVVNGNKHVDGVINVVASRSAHDGNKYVYKLDDNTYASNKVVVSEEHPNTFVLPSAAYTEASYVTLDPLFQNGDTIGIRFKGKNVPSIGLLCTPSEFGSFAISSITGYILSFEYRATNRYTLYIPMSSLTVKDGQASRGELLGVDDLEEDKYYYLTAAMTGNTPTGAKFLHAVHWTMSEIVDYGTPNEHYQEMKTVDISGGWTDYYNIADGRVVLYSSSKRDIIFQVDGLPKQDDGIVQYGGTKLEGFNNYRFENTNNYSPTKKVDGKTVYTGNYSVVNGYFAYDGNFSAGDSVSFTFKGYNIPGVCLFADTISGLTGGGKGLYINPGSSSDYNLNDRLTFYGPYRFDSSDPEHYVSPDGSAYTSIAWNFRVLTDLNSPFGYDHLTDYGDYLYTIKIVKAENDEVVVSVILYDKNNDAHKYELVAERTYYLYNYHGPVSGKIIAYPGFLSADKTTTFSSYPVNTSPLDNEEYFEYNAYHEADGEGAYVELDGPQTELSDKNSVKDLSYLGVSGACEVGKTIRIHFEDKYIPNVCLFADTIDGYAVGGGRGIYLCTSLITSSSDPVLNPAKALDLSHTLMPYAPYRWSPEVYNVYNNNTYKYVYDDLTGYAYEDVGESLRGMGFGYDEVDYGGEYEYSITINSLSGGVASITVEIYDLVNDMSSGEQTFTLDLSSHMSYGEQLGFGNNLIFYGQDDFIWFTYEIE